MTIDAANLSENIIGNISFDTQIYRVIPIHRFFELFDRGTNGLVWPSKWDDPFENFILDAPVRTKDGEKGTFGFKHDLYGQCWTQHKASDAMWRIYSQDCQSVRIRSTVGRLLGSLAASQPEWALSQCFIGKVIYPDERELKQLAESMFKDGLQPQSIAMSLLIKRRAFVHENEVRLIYFEKDTTKHSDSVFAYPIDPHRLIDQVMADPRMPYQDFAQFKDEIVSRTGLAKKQIKRSLLYARPKGFVIDLE